MICHWEKIDGFRTLNELERFITWIEGQIQVGNAYEVPVDCRYAGEMMPERWFVCKDCQSKWRLVFPDPGYFSGLFCLVEGEK
ncbi:hypothetical protein V6L76_17570 [Pannonibacter sp. Pt2]|uniref:Uncharacterized protein n=1 Tax=Pannonibacter anstelovis TaxID=3121537 RepID=A0ABU7ZS80_9HYPH